MTTHKGLGTIRRPRKRLGTHQPTNDKARKGLPTAPLPPESAGRVGGTVLPPWKNKEVFDAKPLAIYRAMDLLGVIANRSGLHHLRFDSGDRAGIDRPRRPWLGPS